MGVAIRGDTAAAVAHRHLARAHADAGRSAERLASGLRINRAADDAAGLGTSERLRSLVGGVRVAARNAQDGISLVDTADGALASGHAVLHRMRDLVVRAAGSSAGMAGTAVAAELAELQAGLDGIARTTAFGGHRLLDGGYRGMFQIGAGVGEALHVAVTTAVDARGLGVDRLVVDGGLGDVRLTAGRADFGGHPATAARLHLDLPGDAAVAALVARLPDPATSVTVDGVAVDLRGVTTLDGLADALRASGGVTVDRTPTGITLTAPAPGPGTVGVTGLPGTQVPGTAEVPDSGGNPASLTARVDLTKPAGAIWFGTDRSLDLATVSASVAAHRTSADRAAALRGALESAFAGAVVSVGDDGAVSITAGAHGDESFSVVASGADVALLALDRAIADVSTVRGHLGAAHNRLGHAASVAATALETLTAARGRITDADAATEATRLARSEILRRAGTALVGQASAAPRGVLDLLR